MKIRNLTGVIGIMEVKSQRVKWIYTVLTIILIIVALVCLIPPLWVLVSSLEDPQTFYSMNPPLLPHPLQFSKIWTTWNELNFGRYYLNSIILAGGALVITTLFDSLFAFVLSRLKPFGSRFMFTVVLLTLMVPTTTAIVPVYKNIVDFPILHINLTNSFIPLWMMYAANAFNVIIFKGFFDGIPMELLEAGQLDGCTSFGLFWRIIMPLSKPVVFTLSIFTLMNVWSDFFWPYLVLQNPNLKTVIVAVYSASTSLSADQTMMALTFAMIPPMILFMVFQKYIMKGLTMTGIKG